MLPMFRDMSKADIPKRTEGIGNKVPDAPGVGSLPSLPQFIIQNSRANCRMLALYPADASLAAFTGFAFCFVLLSVRQQHFRAGLGLYQA